MDNFGIVKGGLTLGICQIYIEIQHNKKKLYFNVFFEKDNNPGLPVNHDISFVN